MAEHTPTTEDVLATYGLARNRSGVPPYAAEAEFDRWLTEHDAQVAAKALREWAAAHLAYYPEDVFVPPTRDDWDWVARLISQHGGVLDAFSAEIMRRAAHIAIKDADAMTRQADTPVSEPDHEFIGVAGHPDDDECTHRADGTDATYCGLTRAEHDAPAADDEGGQE